MSENSDVEYFVDDERKHKKYSHFVADILQLDRRQYVKKPSRTETSTHVSEFNLVKPSTGRRSNVTIGDLTKSLDQRSKHVVIGNKIISATAKATTLRKPLERPQAEKIRRSIGFDNTKTELNKWNSLVEMNRVAAQLTFPLNQGKIDIQQNKHKDIVFDRRFKSELDRELEKLDPVIEAETDNAFPLSMEELMQKRKEMAKLRAQQSYREAKAYKNNKIKSKAFHRIQRKERIRQQIKDFEELKKTDPEEALRKLEQLEKTRAEERMSLRHRSTGQWAKSKQIRAKYDKESRQAIAQQLEISRQLTEKRDLNMDTDSASNGSAVEDCPTDSIPVNSANIDSFVRGYRKFWEEKNKNALESNLSSMVDSKFDKTNNRHSSKMNVVDTAKYADFGESNSAKSENKSNIQEQKEPHNWLKRKIIRPQEVLNKPRCRKGSKNICGHPTPEIKIQKVKFCNNDWTVTEIEQPKSNELVEDMFENLEYQTLSKLNTKLEELKNLSVANKSIRAPVATKVKKNKSDLKFLREKIRPIVDEELTSNLNDDHFDKTKNLCDSVQNSNIVRQKNFLPITVNSKTDKITKVGELSQIDPNKLMIVKETKLASKIPTISEGDDNSDHENDQRAYIAEAFQDDDLVVDFRQEKQNIINKERPHDLDLTLPGWGSWGGKNIKESKRKRKRFIVKAPTEIPRRDDNKGNLIINEKADDKIREHKVSEIPFPFKSVKDYEASIRAPIGDTFLPQTAFRRLIKPSLVIKKGAVIEPMSKDLLLDQKFTKKGHLVRW